MELFKWDNLQRVLADYGKSVAEQYKNNLTPAKTTGKLVSSVDTIVEVGENKIAVKIRLEDYWKYIEYGTVPFWPPQGVIMKWIERKPVIPRPMKNGKLPTPKQLTFLIRRSISKYGIEPKHYLNNAQASLYDEWAERIREAIRQDVKESLVFLNYSV